MVNSGILDIRGHTQMGGYSEYHHETNVTQNNTGMYTKEVMFIVKQSSYIAKDGLCCRNFTKSMVSLFFSKITLKSPHKCLHLFWSSLMSLHIKLLRPSGCENLLRNECSQSYVHSQSAYGYMLAN